MIFFFFFVNCSVDSLTKKVIKSEYTVTLEWPSICKHAFCPHTALEQKSEFFFSLNIPVRKIPRNLPVSDTSCPAVCGTALVSRRHKNHNTRQRVIYPEQTQGQEEREFDLDRGPLTLGRLF